ncbi:DUF4369 domain-containing protein [Confluentibacter flavum]|uniref:DUF4369 domain-containing protein n=1 Tax=Confluentibacter flavum TaxID=1909700 RepID=A0A2N3HKW7_9FLAO|nr:DUF4369 domain-containing protein [Confluentibacter flavum]PKQ45615.1 hypothetical protein CSW08_07115 [Confluentibacter flavum]
MKNFLLLVLMVFIVSCSKETPDLIVKGTIKGLKKGIIYLKKEQDTAIVTVDSVIINGQPDFELHSKIESPEMFFLYLDKNSSEDDRIPFFADKGITEINTSMKNFVHDAKINGSEQQKVWEKYRLMAAKFNEKNLDLIKEDLESQQAGDTSKISRIQKDYDNNLKRRYLYTVNFAINNKDSEVAPYLALTEIYNAKINLLDTINKSLTPEVKASKYGKELQKFVDQIKLEEN